MEGQEQVIDTGVEQAAVAGEQVQEQDTTSVQENTGVDTSVDAAPIKDEKDFAGALKAREAQLRQQIEKEYGEKYQGYETIQQHSEQLKRAARINGWGDDVEGYMTRLEEVERQREIEEEAAKLGVPEDFIRTELQPLKSELQQLKQESETLRQEQDRIKRTEENNKKWGVLFEAYPETLKSLEGWKEGSPLPDWHTPEMESLIQRGYEPIHAYELINRDRILQKKEQEVLANVTGRDGKQVLPSNDRPASPNFSIADASLEDVRKISERVQRGERVTF